MAFLEAYAEFCAQTCLFVRPAAHAAIELGTDTFWPVLDASMQNGLDNFLEALRRVVPGLDESQILALAQAIRRVLLAGLFDRSMTADDIRTGVRMLVDATSTSSDQPDSRAPFDRPALAYEPSLRSALGLTPPAQSAAK